METIPPIIHASWHKHLEPLFQLPEIKELKYRVLPEFEFYPAKQDIFKVFQMPLDKIKVVILGQDPYPSPKHATGLAFATSSNPTIRTPTSLKVIVQELCQEYPNIDFSMGMSLFEFRALEHWFRQGVFLLNTALTVEHMNAGSHTRYWKNFTEGVVKTIASERSPVWMLWGKQAQAFIPTIQGSEIFCVNDILTAYHPAAAANSGGAYTFMGCNHFRQANEILLSNGQQAINW